MVKFIFIIFLLQATFSYSQKTGYDFLMVTEGQNKQAKAIVKNWLKKNRTVDSLELPRRFRIEKLEYNPDEWTLGTLDSIIFNFAQNHSIAYVDSLINIYATEGTFYVMVVTYKKRIGPEKVERFMHFDFDRRMNLQEVAIWNGTDYITVSYFE